MKKRDWASEILFSRLIDVEKRVFPCGEAVFVAKALNSFTVASHCHYFLGGPENGVYFAIRVRLEYFTPNFYLNLKQLKISFFIITTFI